MPLHSVDFQRALVVDLPTGAMQIRDEDRLVALPAAFVSELYSHLPGFALEQLSKQLGESLLKTVRSATPDVATLEAEEAAWALSAALALRGMGTAAFERWGEALLFVWRGVPFTGPSWESFASKLVSFLFVSLTGLEVECAVVHRGETSLRLLLASKGVCQSVRGHLGKGHDWLSALAHLEPAPEST